MTNECIVNESLRNTAGLITVAERHEVSLLKQSARDYIHAATSVNTRKAYQSDVQQYLLWGGVLPATPDQIIQYLTAHAELLNPRTLKRRLTSLKQWHVLQGLADPTISPMVRKTLTGIKNLHGVPKDKAPPMTLEVLQQISTYLQSSNRLIDIRNRALLLVGFFGAFRRSELVGICWEHITWSKEGIEILIPRSKTDPGGEGQMCAIPQDNGILCPVMALQQWRDAVGIETGRVFRRISKTENILENAINAQHVNCIVKTIASDCQLPDAEHYSSHSLRRGFATAASKLGAPFGAIQKQGRWRDSATVLGYIEEGKRFESNAAGIILQSSARKY